MYNILVINTGSTSTKLAIYHDMEKVMEQNLHLHLPEGADRTNTDDQLKARMETVNAFLAKSGLSMSDFDIIASRCGQIPREEAQVYWVNQLMCDVLRYKPVSNHASNYAPMISMELAKGTDLKIIAPHAPTAYEMMEIAQVSGCKEAPYRPGCHVLNSKYVSRLSAEKLGKKYEEGTFIVAHMGGGSSTTLHVNGKMIDVFSAGLGSMSTERAGFIAARDMIRLCKKYSEKELNALLFNNGGYTAYGGTNDALDMENRALAGDKDCKLAYEASAYQTAKAIGAHYFAAKGKVDAIILTGSLARSKYLTDMITDYISFIGAPIDIYPGEREMDALADFAIRALDGDIEPLAFDKVPPEYNGSIDAFYADVKK